MTPLHQQASQDLEDIDKQRRDEFKRYELEKEAEKQDKLSHMDEEHRKEEVIKLEEMKKKHADHPKIHHPVRIGWKRSVSSCLCFVLVLFISLNVSYM